MGEKMSNAPVYYALAQAQFNPVAAMAKYVDEIQDHLRRKGYPLFDPHMVTHLQFAALPGQAPVEPQVVHAMSWLITRADRSAGYILSPNAIIFHTTHYDTRDAFIPEILQGLKIVHDVVGLDHVSRLGLRYLDAVLPGSEENIDQYLVDGLHGIRFGATQRYALNESVFDTDTGPIVDKGTLVARVHRSVGILGYPPDMVPNGLVPMPRFAGRDEVSHAIIDTDHFVEGRLPLDFDRIGEQLVDLHGTIKRAFAATVSNHANAVWA